MKTKGLSIIVFLLFGFFLFYRIGRASINNDAHFWYARTMKFMDSVRDKDWEDTMQNPKPGVSVMWMSGIPLKTFFFLYEKKFGYVPSIMSYDTFPYVHYAVITPLVTLVFITLIFLYKFLREHLGKEIALFTLILLSFQPFVIGLSRNFHADSTVMSFMLLSSLFAISYYYSQKKKWIILSGVTAGLALLSKSAAIFLIPYFGFLALIFYDFDVKKLVSWLPQFLILLVSICLTFIILFPAMWVLPKATLHGIFISEGMTLVTTGRDGVNPFWYYAEPLFRILTPVFIISFGCGVVAFILGYKKEKEKTKKLLIMFLGFVFFYILQMSLVKQKMDRYLLPAIPFMAIVGGYGVSRFITEFKNKKLLTLTFFVINLSYLIYYFPNYLIYPSIKGKDQFGCSLCSDIGAYLNSQHSPADLKIISISEKLHRLQPFVMGRVYTKNEILPNSWTPEYVVATVHDDIPQEYSYCWYDKTISFRNIDYWIIYKCKER